MNSKKMYFIMIGLLVLVIGALLATVVMGDRFLKKQSDKLFAARLDQMSLNEQQTALTKAKRDLEKYSGLLNVAKGIVPQDKNQAQAVREIVQFANESGVGIESISYDDSSLGQSSSTATTGASGSQPAATTTPATQSSPVTQAKPVSGMPGVYSVPIEIVSTKESTQFSNFVTFLSKLENNRRTAQVKKISITTGATTSGKEYINFSLTVNNYVKP